MSVKRFCDCCDAEITPENIPGGVNQKGRLTGEYRPFGNTLKPKLRFEVITGIQSVSSNSSVWNDGDWCKYCIIDAINSSDDRPKVAGD